MALIAPIEPATWPEALDDEEIDRVRGGGATASGAARVLLPSKPRRTARQWSTSCWMPGSGRSSSTSHARNRGPDDFEITRAT